MENHSWYLHPSLIPLSLVDPEVPNDLKAEIAQIFFNELDKGNISLIYEKINISSIINDPGDSLTLVQFVGRSSKTIFDLIGLDVEHLEWMNIPPDQWEKLNGFRRFRDFVNQLPVTNDSAERNVKLVQDFIDGFRTDESR